MSTINCDCDDTTGYRTRAEIRRSIIVLCGWAAVADNPPPGVADYVNEQLRLAHSLLFTRFPAIRTQRWFTWSLAEGQRFYDLAANDERAGLGVPAAPAVNGNDGGGTLAAGTYTYRLARANDDGTTLPGPIGQATVGTGTGSCEVYLPAATPGQTEWIIYGRDGTVGALASVAVADIDPLAPYWTDTGEFSPGSAVETTDGTVTCTKAFDPYAIKEAWYERDTQRTRLCQGLPSSELVREQTGWPSHFDVRQCLEIWPAPDATEGRLRLLARFAKTAFDADDDVPGVPDDMVQLLALAKTKRHYGKADANDYIREMEVLISDLTAGSHGVRRYIPGEPTQASGWVEPRPSGPFD